MNWRSPSPPVGKRAKIQLESSTSDDCDDGDFIQDRIDLVTEVLKQNQQIQLTGEDAEYDEDSSESSSSSLTTSDDDDDEHNDNGGVRHGHAHQDGRTKSGHNFKDSDDEDHEHDHDPYGINELHQSDDSVSTDLDGAFNFDEGVDSEDEDDLDTLDPGSYLKHDPTPETQYPKPDWITINELRQRRCGFPSSKQPRRPASMYWFERYVNNSLWMIQRLELSRRLKGHAGSVNSLDYNSNGNLICSGSDDLSISIWDWQSDKLKRQINTGHANNVFHSQFCCSDESIITASRDGTVRLVNIETSKSELLMQQSGEVEKLAFITPQTLVTCGTNASVNLIDLRTRDSTRLFIVRHPRNHRSCGLHSITAHPIDKHKIAVGGDTPYVSLYDLRRARGANVKAQKLYYVIDSYESRYNIVTSTAFNSNGDKLLISYNDDDLFVCSTERCEVLHRYKGHRNKKTIKGCAWFGDNFVLSGSDDGHIYGWDVQSEHIVCFLEGDVTGAVNCLSVHPSLPVLASSGLDHDVKLWQPTSSTWPQTLKGIKPQICKNAISRKRSRSAQSRLYRFVDQNPDQDTSESSEGESEEISESDNDL